MEMSTVKVRGRGLVLSLCLLALGSVPAFALDFNDVKNLIKNQVAESVIVNMVRQDASLAITADEANELRAMGASETLVASIPQSAASSVATYPADSGVVAQSYSAPYYSGGDEYVQAEPSVVYQDASSYYGSTPVYPDGTIILQDGTVIYPQNTVTYPSTVVTAPTVVYETAPTYVYPRSSPGWSFSFGFGSSRDRYRPRPGHRPPSHRPPSHSNRPGGGRPPRPR